MKSWKGSAAICVNDSGEVLMVRCKGDDGWAVPSGGIEEGENPEQCCIREVKEETGYDIALEQKLFTKQTEIKGIQVETHYFEAIVTGGEMKPDDPDDLVLEVGWKDLATLDKLSHTYPEDTEYLLRFIKK
ncbi:NUDIX hydrolase [Pseudalkalibacillus caeni]|uniref:NUDIX hydrolase n=1 Tax=Exobacillus caeni TaxID=2574798 RepID=A0A5R9F2E8_9BACL|nr:NUDIX hydrolase [Pseudalkalibacillus caeni]TLS37261.1 NUDIX hydrolase [Pseudalkalibacillus caeni]